MLVRCHTPVVLVVWAVSSGFPHLPQNFVPGAHTVPQCGQIPSAGRERPHWIQKRASRSFTVPQTGQTGPSDSIDTVDGVLLSGWFFLEFSAGAGGIDGAFCAGFCTGFIVPVFCSGSLFPLIGASATPWRAFLPRYVRHPARTTNGTARQSSKYPPNASTYSKV